MKIEPIATALMFVFGVLACIYALVFAESQIESVAYGGCGLALIAIWTNCKLDDRIKAVEVRLKEVEDGQETR